MPLAAGDKLGPYEILTPLGAGGMGEVYRARDSKLEREVAVKVLPEFLANDPERLARFDREAKILAALNHPNIAAVFGLVESGTQRALVMELAPGDTLAALIQRGPMSPKNAPPIADGVPSPLFQTRMDTSRIGTSGWGYAVTRDGRFLVQSTAGDSKPTPLTIVSNWWSAIRK